MQQESRRPDENAPARGPLKPPLRRDRSQAGGRKPRGAEAGSLTAKLLDYRNWWNLPPARPRKSHS